MRRSKMFQLLLPDIGGRAPTGNKNQRRFGFALPALDHVQRNTIRYFLRPSTQARLLGVRRATCNNSKDDRAQPEKASWHKDEFCAVLERRQTFRRRIPRHPMRATVPISPPTVVVPVRLFCVYFALRRNYKSIAFAILKQGVGAPRLFLRRPFKLYAAFC